MNDSFLKTMSGKASEMPSTSLNRESLRISI